MSSANFISDAEKAEHLNYADGKGVKRVSLYNDGVQVNAATEETLQKTAPGTNMEGGGIISVGTNAVEVTFTGTTKSIIITADSTNTGILYIGKSNVTSAGANALTYLGAGDSITIDYDDTTNAIYVVASVAGQNFLKGATL